MPSKEVRHVLGQVDHYVLLAILRLNSNAYGVSIRDEIEARTGQQISTGSIYLALDRLQRGGLIQARVGEPTAERGGRRKTYYQITARGVHAASTALKGLKSLATGTSLKGAFV